MKQTKCTYIIFNTFTLKAERIASDGILYSSNKPATQFATRKDARDAIKRTNDYAVNNGHITAMPSDSAWNDCWFQIIPVAPRSSRTENE